MTKVGLLARLEAKPGRETEVAKYLEEKALPYRSFFEQVRHRVRQEEHGESSSL